MKFNVPKVPEVPKIDPALAEKITQLISNVSLQIIEETPPGEIVEDVIKGEITEIVMREIEPMLEGNKMLIKGAEKLVEKGIDKAWEGILDKLKDKVKEPQPSEEISITDVGYCGKCGSKVDESWNVCQNCGVELDQALYQKPEVFQEPEIIEPPVVPEESKEPPVTPPISQSFTQYEEESGPYHLCEHYSPLPSGASCEHYDERTYDCDYYGVDYCPLNKQIAKFRAKKKYLISVLKTKVERKAFRPNEYYNDVFEKEYMKKH